MSYPIKYPTPQGANVQIFSQGGTTSDWVKPQGASFVWFTLIGAGGIGDAATFVGGGSAAVTNFMCPAFLIPDQLRVSVANGKTSTPTATSVIYQQKNTTGYTLLTANGGAAGGSGTAGSAMTANAFTAMGFFQSVAGQNGVSGAVSASTTTFLSGGGSNNQNVTGNYGYTTNSAANANGFFQLQPIIVGLAGMNLGNGGVGCGGGSTGTSTGYGGNGLAVIITW